MGILNSKEEGPAPASTNASRQNLKKKREYTEEEIFAVKETYLECWTARDVALWLNHKQLPQYVEILQQLCITGDGLLHLYTSLGGDNTESNPTNNISGTNNKDNENINRSSNNSNNTPLKEDTSRNSSNSSSSSNNNSSNSNSNKYAALFEKLQQIDPTTYDNFITTLSTVCSAYLKSGGRDKPQKEYLDYVPEIPITDENNLVESWSKVVMFYHLTTQHTKKAASRSVDRNWFNQPRIFRRYYMAEYIPLLSQSTTTQNPEIPYNSLFDNCIPSAPLNPRILSDFLFYSLSISGCREPWELASMPRSAWSKRVNPSSGGLHPIETYLILGENTYASQNEPGVFHYNPQQHVLEKRLAVSNEVFSKILGVENSTEGFLIGVSSIHWREVWKYGERAFRYCLLDAGHVIGAIAISALRLGWQARVVNGVDAKTVENLLGLTLSNKELDSNEQERGLILIAVSTNRDNRINVNINNLNNITQQLVSQPENWIGSPNTLSQNHSSWEVVTAVDNATRCPYTTTPEFTEPVLIPPLEQKLKNLSAPSNADHVIRFRRSALDFNGAPVSLHQFLHIMWHLTPKCNPVPWASLSLPPQVNLFVFVYNVTDLPTGLYALIRNRAEFGKLCNATKNAEFLWEIVENEFDVPLYLLKKLDAEKTGNISFESSCHQSIASHKNGAFSVGMFANLKQILGLGPESSKLGLGPSGYLAAHYECGLIGHMLYLEAHALRLGATGMGCFIDDMSRETFGLESDDPSYFPLYHFAIGIPDNSHRYKPFDYSRDMFDGVLQECVDCTLK